MRNNLLTLGFFLFLGAAIGILAGTVVFIVALVSGNKKDRKKGLYILLYCSLIMLASFTLCSLTAGGKF